MDSIEYMERALETELKPATLNFGEVGLHVMLSVGIVAAQAMDIMKKTAFYGKEFNADKIADLAETLGGLSAAMHELRGELANKNDLGNYIEGGGLPEAAENVKPENVNMRLLHSAVGIFTEGGELLEACRKQLETGTMDVVNFAEELADVDWYKQIGHSETGIPEAVTRAKNIEKLAARKKRTGGDMINRDVVEERKILEEQVQA